jgi:hypothetical protein
MSNPSTQTCTRTLGPADAAQLRDVIAALPDGATLCLEPGHYPARLVFKRSLSMRGLGAPGEVVLDGGAVPGVVIVDQDGLHVALARLTITGGSGSPASTVGAISVGGQSDVSFEDVIVSGNRCDPRARRRCSRPRAGSSSRAAASSAIAAAARARSTSRASPRSRCATA